MRWNFPLGVAATSMPRSSSLSVWPTDSAPEVSQSESEDTCRVMSLSEAEFWQAQEL